MKKLTVILAALVLAGCSGTLPMVQVVSQQTMTEIKLDPETLKVLPPVLPPDPNQYIDMSFDEREDAMTRYSLELMNQNAIYRINIESITKLVAKQNDVIKDFNQKEDERVKKLKKVLEAGN